MRPHLSTVREPLEPRRCLHCARWRDDAWTYRAYARVPVGRYAADGVVHQMPHALPRILMYHGDALPEAKRLRVAATVDSATGDRTSWTCTRRSGSDDEDQRRL